MSVVTPASQVDMMADILRDPCTIRLYVNDIPESPTAADFVEPDGFGYVGKPMRMAAWDMTRAPEEATYPRQKWTFSGAAGLVRGYYVTRNSDGRLRWFEPLKGGPMRVVNEGDEISVAVSLEFGAKIEQVEA